MLCQKFSVGIALVAVCALGSAAVQAATIIPSPANDILLSSAGGVADINGSTVDGPANYGGLPPANLNDGDRDGIYNNGAGVDGSGSISHTSGSAVNQEMGVRIPTATPLAFVDVFNRTDCCAGRIDDSGTIPFTLNIFNGATLTYTHNYDFTPTISLTATGASASGMVIAVAGTGTYVQIVQHNGDYMNLAELEAYRTPEPSSLFFAVLGPSACSRPLAVAAKPKSDSAAEKTPPAPGSNRGFFMRSGRVRSLYSTQPDR